MSDFKVLTANPVFYRSYSRVLDGFKRESFTEVKFRCLEGLRKLGKLEEFEFKYLEEAFDNHTFFPSGRWLWVGGTKWLENPENFPGAYNCTSLNLDNIKKFGMLMELAMMGCGTGANLDKQHIFCLPKPRNHLTIHISKNIGTNQEKNPETSVEYYQKKVIIKVGDSRQGWVESYQELISIACDGFLNNDLDIYVDLSNVRKEGERIKGFGGVSNPSKLTDMYGKIAKILNKATDEDRFLTSVELCLLIDEAALVVVAGNVRRSAGIRQVVSDDLLFAAAKMNLWSEDESGVWSIDPERDALRMANHTRVFHQKPSKQQVLDSVRSQYYCGEGAIQWAGEAVARSNADILKTPTLKMAFLQQYSVNPHDWLESLGVNLSSSQINERLNRYSLNPCVTGDTWVLTDNGARQVRDLIGKKFTAIVYGEKFQSTNEGFFKSGLKGVYQLTTEKGYQIKLTDNHKLNKLIRNSNHHNYFVWCELKDLKPGDEIELQNHRYITPWLGGQGDMEEGYIIGNFFAGSKDEPNDKEMQVIDKYPRLKVIEKASYEFYRGFFKNLYECHGSIKDSSIVLNLKFNSDIKAIQRMLSNTGIISEIKLDTVIIRGDNISVFSKLIGSEIEGIGKEQEESYEEFQDKIKSIDFIYNDTVYDCTIPEVHAFSANGITSHNCGEIIGNNFFCNLSEVHLNNLEPEDEEGIYNAFLAASISACSLLYHNFSEFSIEMQVSRLRDPIIGVSFTGLFDFFVKAFGVGWLEWWNEGRPNNMKGKIYRDLEQGYLSGWKNIVKDVVSDFCMSRGLKMPNRFTTVQPSGTKSLLTGASPGWHPPKSQYYIRRITFAAYDPVALACIDCGYNIIPGMADKKEDGSLLDDPFDPNCTEWLVEIPCKVAWADLQGASNYDISKFSALSQFDFYMQVQKYYTTHNTSATIEIRENEIEEISQRIFEAIRDDEGYISATILARFDDKETYPRLPFEPIDKLTYEDLMIEIESRSKSNDFQFSLYKFDIVSNKLQTSQPPQCDSLKCI